MILKESEKEVCLDINMEELKHYYYYYALHYGSIPSLKYELYQLTCGRLDWEQ